MNDDGRFFCDSLNEKFLILGLITLLVRIIKVYSTIYFETKAVRQLELLVFTKGQLASDSLSFCF